MTDDPHRISEIKRQQYLKLERQLLKAPGVGSEQAFEGLRRVMAEPERFTTSERASIMNGLVLMRGLCLKDESRDYFTALIDKVERALPTVFVVKERT